MDLCDGASRAMFALLNKRAVSSLMLLVDEIFDLFDKTIVPSSTYGCQVCGHGITEMTSKLQ